MLELLCDGPVDSARRLVFAHGAGAGMQSQFMNEFAQALAARGVRVVRFEFPYMQRRREGVRAGPDRAPLLLDTWRQVVAELGGGAGWFIGGKSMGGRMASMIADELGVRGLVCVGYPFHPPRRPDKTRVEHLKALRTRCLIVQGTRDPFGTPDDVQSYVLSKRIRVAWIEGGDHSLVPSRRAGHDKAAAWALAVGTVIKFVSRAT